MVIASSYPFFGVLWSMLVFFLWVSWFVMLFHVIGDVFRRDDASGWNKTLWLIFLVLVPFIGVFAYLISQSHDMTRRDAARMEARGVYAGPAVVADDPVAEIERAKRLLDTGAISQAEFDAIKARVLG
jgi:Phospholipase_D-nuclease N-terminal/Short C-terminal domain